MEPVFLLLMIGEGILMENKKMRPGLLITFAGALLAYLIGSGTASGQEFSIFRAGAPSAGRSPWLL